MARTPSPAAARRKSSGVLVPLSQQERRRDEPKPVQARSSSPGSASAGSRCYLAEAAGGTGPRQRSRLRILVQARGTYILSQEWEPHRRARPCIPGVYSHARTELASRERASAQRVESQPGAHCVPSRMAPAHALTHAHGVLFTNAPDAFLAPGAPSLQSARHTPGRSSENRHEA